ncbi:carboxypeptidase Y-deficient [Coemansia erecta]|uniref:Carboxypeptidase Y-deficient n=1 Tax=Coemansia erecta TaxID=147472 RepID=A0A9W7Y3U4_9FUNG|nr:carboxypeptidase Y-deficient [Coemansia erecta]
MHSGSANSPASANSTTTSAPHPGPRHVRRAARTLGPARHTRSQSATPPTDSSPTIQSVRRSTVSSGDAPLHCPICGVMAPSLAALNMHLDDAHFGGSGSSGGGRSGGGGEGRAGGGADSRGQRGAAQDDLEDVKGAILGFFRGAGRAVKGLGGSSSPAGSSSSPAGSEHVSPAGHADGAEDWWQGGRNRATARPPRPAEGASRRHTAHFERLRAAHMSGALLEGNRAEKRLEKLARAHAQHGGAGGAGLQAAEKLIVAWQPDADTAQCMQCQRAFGRLLARRHHCRVCGQLVCGRASCSAMLRLPLPLGGDHLAGAFSADSTAEVRACASCLGIVGRVQERVRRLRARAEGPGEVQRLYAEAREAMRMADRVLPAFNALVLRIAPQSHGVAAAAAGSPDVALVARAARIRSQLTDAFGRVDGASRRIAEGPAVSPGDARVRAAIRSAMVQYLQLHMFSLTMLPRIERKGSVGRNSKGTVMMSPPQQQLLQTQPETDAALVADEVETASADTRSIGTPASESLSVSSEPPMPSAGLARSLLSYIVPRRVSAAATGGASTGPAAGSHVAEELIQRALASDPGKETRIAGMALDEKLASLDVLRDQRQRVLGYIAEAQRDRRLEDARTLQASLTDLDVELSLIERNL